MINPTADKNIQYSIQNLQINVIILTGVLITFSFIGNLQTTLGQVLFTSLIGCIILIFSLTSILYVGMMHGKIDLLEKTQTDKIRKILQFLSTIGYILMIGLGLILIFDMNYSTIFSFS